MGNDLFRVESAVSATSSGNLTWDNWPHDCAVALGFSGRRNPLGFAVVRYLSDAPSSVSVWGVVLILAKEMQRQGVVADGLQDLAFKAFDFWRDSRCPACHGRGEQAGCQPCNNTGRRAVPDAPEALRIGIHCLIEAEQRMEGQLASRLRGASYPASEPGVERVYLSQKVDASVELSGGPRKAPYPPHE